MAPRSFVRDTYVNFAGQVLPPLVGLAALPVIVRQMGAGGFGILSLLWVFQAQVGLLDLGLGRATTKFTAEFVGSARRGDLPILFWSSLALHGALGLACGLLLAVSAPVLVNHVLNVPEGLVAESKLAFAIVGLALPFTLLSGALRGILEGLRSFIVTNVVKVASRTATFLIPAMLPTFGIGLVGVALGMVALEIATCLAFLVFCLREIPELRKTFGLDSQIIRTLTSFSAWIAISNVVGPVLFSIDRFLIGWLLTMTAVAYYVVPSQLLGRFYIMPASLTVTLFPVLSSMSGSSSSNRDEAIGGLYAKSLKNMLVILGTFLLPVSFFSREILHIWMGPDFAENGATVMQVLAVGVLANSLARMPYDLLQAIGNAKFTGKLHLLQLPLYLVLGWFFVAKFGILGAAAIWSLRIVAEAVVLFAAVNRCCRNARLSCSQNKFFECVWVFFGMFMLPIVTTAVFPGSLTFRVLLGALAVGVSASVVWRNLVTMEERRYLKGLFLYALAQRTN